MENIDALFKMQRAHCSAGAAYDYFCDEMENCLPFVFGCTREIRDLAVDAADEKLLLRSTILAAANKMYLDCCFNALRQEENSGIPFCPIWRKNAKSVASIKGSTAFAFYTFKIRYPAVPRGLQP